MLFIGRASFYAVIEIKTFVAALLVGMRDIIAFVTLSPALELHIKGINKQGIIILQQYRCSENKFIDLIFISKNP